MSKSSQPNFPDILGKITGQQRLHFGVIEAAVALNPSPPRSGEVFEAILLLQNTVDDNVEVMATPKIPEGYFVARYENMKVNLTPGEVGFLSLPLSVSPNAAPKSGYKMSIDISVNHKGKPNLIRHTDEPASPDYYSFIKKETLPKIAGLKKLSFSANKSSLLNRGIETTFSLLAGSKSKATSQNTPRWNRLWTLVDNTDLRLLMERYHTVFREKILPLLTREILYEALRQATSRRFAGHGYSLQPDEVHYITKLLVHVLELAHQSPQPMDYPGQELYHVGNTLKHSLPNHDAQLLLPRWCRAFLARIDTDRWIMEHPVVALATLLYDDLLHDGILHGFELVHHEIDYSLGSQEDAAAYARRFVNTLRDKSGQFTFEDVYLPLILGGILVDVHVLLPNERPDYRLHDIHELIRRQRPPGGPETERILIHSVSLKVCKTALQRFTHWS